MNNPWDVNRITWGDPFADGDKEALAKMGYYLCQGKQKFDSLMRSKDLRKLVENCKLNQMYHECCIEKFKNSIPNKDANLDFYTLPEPFTGDVDSPVYCLNMNPGKADDLFVNDPTLLLLTLLTLDHSLKHSFWVDSFFKKYKKYDNSIAKSRSHGGCDWFVKRTNKLGEKPRLFMVEFFPYHSNHGFVFPSWLPSYEYTNCLIEEAMDKGKFIVIMRQKDQWFQRIPRLKNYKKLAFLECGQGAFLSQNNVIYKSNAFNDLVAALKQ